LLQKEEHDQPEDEVVEIPFAAGLAIEAVS